MFHDFQMMNRLCFSSTRSVSFTQHDSSLQTLVYRRTLWIIHKWQRFQYLFIYIDLFLISVTSEDWLRCKTRSRKSFISSLCPLDGAKLMVHNYRFKRIVHHKIKILSFTSNIISIHFFPWLINRRYSEKCGSETSDGLQKNEKYKKKQIQQ